MTTVYGLTSRARTAVNGRAAEFAVLAILSPGGQLTAQQLSEQARLTAWATRGALARLEKRGLVVSTYGRARWRVTKRGRAAVIVKGERFAS
ncbi:hypothetical protein IU500_08100 [Nocardia terpenica]|uniref:MarR family transcriptional regulator n=1 Tax=Nocardia terpenica TaxID=455432 RepID=A0A164KEY5_9NOCA|nr:hypothetical protein [Nocardia terpenica]KZM71329.1 hypothetical protein AWN90_00685 [Nocardia terpenica]MBF6060738.1 hypothetical protein [Nocardia terpenica]MBF6103998.1 hypothetical protein [Nocardia terpenica]MBF6111628.1 hypothetical protein [Nocardia terpenica]MBF6118219.1 hypothetical protein [Nocardia terpenica]